MRLKTYARLRVLTILLISSIYILSLQRKEKNLVAHFSKLNNLSSELIGIEDYSVGKVSLEDLFIECTQENEKEEDETNQRIEAKKHNLNCRVCVKLLCQKYVSSF